MNHPVALPALDGRDPLGFLAALGLLRVLTNDLGTDVGLSFSDQTGEAIMHSPYTQPAEIADHLADIVANMPIGTVIPHNPPDYPLTKEGTKGGDPMRASRAEHRRILDEVSLHAGGEGLTWHHAIVTDLGHDDKGRVVLTPYMAPVGQQTVRSFFEKTTNLVRARPAYLSEALTGWRRVSGYTGEYLDHRVLRSAADQPDGESSEIGVPGATWLVIMALPMLRLVGNGTMATATLWRRGNNRTPTMIWPIWRQPLNFHAATVLIEHPDLLRHRDTHRSGLQVRTERWPALGIFAMGVAQRKPMDGRKSAGVLTPIQLDSIG